MGKRRKAWGGRRENKRESGGAEMEKEAEEKMRARTEGRFLANRHADTLELVQAPACEGKVKTDNLRTARLYRCADDDT